MRGWSDSERGQGERTALRLTRRANLPRRFKSVSSAIQNAQHGAVKWALRLVALAQGHPP